MRIVVLLDSYIVLVMNHKRILIATGGTGGHLFPAKGLGEQLREGGGVEIAFAGSKLTTSPHFHSADFSLHNIDAAPLRMNPKGAIHFSYRFSKGFFQSVRLLRQYSPHLVIGFGSFYTLPQLIAAKLYKVPIFLHEANAIPGKVNRLLSPYATVTALHIPSAKQFLKGACIEAGMPLRSGYRKNAVDKEASLRHFGLSSQKPILLVLGGSQGAETINDLVVGAFKRSALKDHYQLIHCVGNQKSADRIGCTYDKLGVKAYVTPFESRMDYALRAADVSISRAGASTIAELVEFEVPGLVIPFPKSMEDHQTANGLYYQEVVRGGACMQEEGLAPTWIANWLLEGKFQSFREKIQAYKIEKKETNLYNVVSDFLKL